MRTEEDLVTNVTETETKRKMLSRAVDLDKNLSNKNKTSGLELRLGISWSVLVNHYQAVIFSQS